MGLRDVSYRVSSLSTEAIIGVVRRTIGVVSFDVRGRCGALSEIVGLIALRNYDVNAESPAWQRHRRLFSLCTPGKPS